MSIFPMLSKLTITLDDGDFGIFSNTLKRHTDELHGQFIKNNTETEVVGDFLHSNSVISITKERILIRKSHSMELHWMTNLDGRSVHSSIDRSSTIEDAILAPFEVNKLKFVNQCADQTLDISMVMHASFDSVHSLDIVSNGPISVNQNVSVVLLLT